MGNILHGTVSSAVVIILLLVSWAGVKSEGDREKHCTWKSKEFSSDHIYVIRWFGVKTNVDRREAFCMEQ